MTTRQGKCTRCRLAFRWPAKWLPLWKAHCPKCGERLQATSHLLTWPWNNEVPLDCSGAIALRGPAVRSGY